MEKITNYEQLKTNLKKLRVWGKFQKACKDEEGASIESCDDNHIYPHDAGSYFVWSSSKEGRKFWLDIDGKLRLMNPENGWW